MARRRFFEHSSFLPAGSDGAPLSPATPRSRSSQATAVLIRRLDVAIASARPEDVGALRNMVRQLEDASRLHAQAALFETLDDVCLVLQIVSDSFTGPLQRAVMDGKQVSLTALDAEITRMLAAKARIADPPRFEHRVAFRKTAAAQSRVAVLAERTLTGRRHNKGAS